MASLDSSATAETSGATSLSWDHTCSGSSRTLLVNVLYADWHTGTISGVTYGGVALSVVPGSTNSFIYINLESIQYYLPNPPLGTHEVVVNANYSVGIVGISVSLNGTNGSIRNVLYDAEYGNSADPTGGSGGYQFAAQAGDILVTFLAITAAERLLQELASPDYRKRDLDRLWRGFRIMVAASAENSFTHIHGNPRHRVCRNWRPV